MKRIIFATALVAFCSTSFAVDQPVGTQSVPPLKDPAEQAAWQTIAARFDGAPQIKSDKPKTLELGVAVLKGKPGDVGSASILVDKEGGHVVEVTSNGAGFGDEEFKSFAAFSQLRSLTLWHNSGFTGAGIAYLAKLPKLENITLAGGSLSDVGMAEIAKIPTIKGLRIFHSKVSDAGMAMIANHPAIESITIAAQWSPLLTDKCLQSLATMPKLQKLSIDESWLTWDGGLKYFAARKEPLTEINLGKCIIEPAEVEKLKQALPKTKVTWLGLGSGAEMLKKPWLHGTAEKWIPKELLDRVMAERAKAEPAK